MHRKYGYLVNKDCCPNKKFIIFRSTQINHYQSFFPFHLDANSSVEDFDKMGMRSFSSFWEKGCLAPVHSVDPSHINSTEVAVRAMVCWLAPSKPWNSKFHTTLLALSPPTQILCTCIAYHEWHPSFILVTKLLSRFLIVLWKWMGTWVSAVRVTWSLVESESLCRWGQTVILIPLFLNCIIF